MTLRPSPKHGEEEIRAAETANTFRERPRASGGRVKADEDGTNVDGGGNGKGWTVYFTL